jgi:hypothetical protein
MIELQSGIHGIHHSNTDCLHRHSDVAWSPGHDGKPVSVSLGVFIQLFDGSFCSQVYISAIAAVSSGMRAEVFGLILATKAA